ERTADDEAPTKIVKVSYLVEENLSAGSEEAIAQARECESFEQERESLGIPASEAGITWCLRAAYSPVHRGLLSDMLQTIRSVLRIPHDPETTSKFLDSFTIQSDPKGIPEGKVSFTYIFPAVSEMSTKAPMADSLAASVALFGFLAILALQFMELRRLQWHLSIGL